MQFVKFVKLEDVEKILGDIYESMGSNRRNWCDPLRKNDVEEWCWSDDKNNDFVEHAYWTRKRTLSHDGELYCSNCEWTPEVLGGTTLGDLQLADVFYCPHCGAKMDEEVGDE